MAKIIKGDVRGRPGKWLVDWRDPAGVRRIKTFNTKREAEDFYAEVLKNQDVRTKPVVNTNITLPDYAAHWLDVLKKAQGHKERSLTIYETQFRLYVLPTFAEDQKVRTLQRAQVKGWLLNLRERLAKNTVKTAYCTLRALLSAAIDDGIVSVNVAAGLGKLLKLGKVKQREDVRAMTREQVRLFFDTADTEAALYYPLLLTMYHCGLRIGEALGLHLDDVDLQNTQITVQRTIDDTGKEGRPKSGKSRTVDMSQELVACLKRYKAERAAKLVGRGLGNVPWMFPSLHGTPTPMRHFTITFKRVLKAAGLPMHFTPHCLRHTYASLLLEEDGGRLLYVSRQLGHASISITADLYAKWIKPVGKGITDSLSLSAQVSR